MSTSVLDPPQAPPELDHTGGGWEWVRLATARHDIEAHLLTGRLETIGIETRTIKDRRLSASWAHGGSNPWSPVDVFVRRFQHDDARIALAEMSYDAPVAERPSAGEPPSNRLVWWIAALALGVLLSGIGLARTADALRDVCLAPQGCESP